MLSCESEIQKLFYNTLLSTQHNAEKHTRNLLMATQENLVKESFLNNLKQRYSDLRMFQQTLIKMIYEMFQHFQEKMHSILLLR